LSVVHVDGRRLWFARRVAADVDGAGVGDDRPILFFRFARHARSKGGGTGDDSVSAERRVWFHLLLFGLVEEWQEPGAILEHARRQLRGLSDRGIYWLNLINLFPAQRSFLFGVPIGLLVFSIFAIVWQRWHESPHDKIDQANLPSTRTLMLVAGVLTGLLPWFHTHTYIAVGLISVV